jgi:hypothetical protein
MQQQQQRQQQQQHSSGCSCRSCRVVGGVVGPQTWTVNAQCSPGCICVLTRDVCVGTWGAPSMCVCCTGVAFVYVSVLLRCLSKAVAAVWCLHTAVLTVGSESGWSHAALQLAAASSYRPGLATAAVSPLGLLRQGCDIT